MRNEIDEDRMKTVVDKRKIDVMGVVEHWRGDDKRMRKSLGLEVEVARGDLFGEQYQWWERCRMKGKRGGVGLIVRKNVGRVDVKEELCCESVIWVEITGGGEALVVCVAYVAPERSVYEHERVETLSKIAQGLEWARGKNVVVLMDANGRIGKLSLEVLAGGNTWVEERQSEDKQVNRQGVEILELLQLHKVLVRNGLLEEHSGGATCRGKSVVDWIAVSWKLRMACKPLVVETAWEDGKRKEGDHKLVRLDLVWEGERREDVKEGERVEKKVKQERKGWNTKEGWKDEWMRVRNKSTRVMKKWCREWEGRPGLEQVKSWQKSFNQIAQKSLGRNGEGRRKKCFLGKEIEALVRKSRVNTLEGLEGKGGRKELRAEIQRQVRKKLFEIKRKEMEKLEQGVGREDFIRALNRQTDGGGRKEGREKMRKGPGGSWLKGDDMKKEWVETFARVGRELKEKKGFDDEFKSKVEEQVKMWGLEEDDEEEEEIEEELGGEWRKTSLNGEIERIEVKEAIRRLKNNKSAGVDEVVAEILKYGGKWMVESVYQVCSKLFSEEEMPVAWLRAIKVPIKKKGSGEEYGHYRGVTLLSCVGKVYAMVLERRMRLSLENRHKLGDGQFGFRKNRSTVDAIFIVDEKVRKSKGKQMFLGFLDIEKAYPSVWREGLWFKLKQAGITGRMWRVIKKFYEHCEVAVKVNGELQEWYEEVVGLREGCVLSPLIFAVYIAELATEIESKVEGVMVLLFADDVIIVADTRKDLQKALDIAFDYSRKWRFAFNVGVEKSAVLVVGKGGGEAIHPRSTVLDSFFLGEREIPFTQEYKYLGVIMEGGRGKKARRQAALKRARGAFWRAWGLGMGKEEMSAKAAAKLWEVLVMPVLEYGAELESGNWDEAERLQRMAGRIALGVGNSVADEVVLGELGWSTVRARFEMKRLKYWWKLVDEGGRGRLGQAYHEGRNRVQEGQAKQEEWCWQTRKVLLELGMGEVWEKEEVGEKREWGRRVKKAMEVRSLREWRDGLAKKGKLWLYRQVKVEPKKEYYLRGWRKRVARMVRLRAGVAALQVELGRRWNKRRVERICKECDQGKVEDEIHFLVECPKWAKHRGRMWELVREGDKKEWGRAIAMGGEGRAVWLLKEGGVERGKEVGQMLETWVREREGKETS
jgi:hypothetical protein